MDEKQFLREMVDRYARTGSELDGEIKVRRVQPDGFYQPGSLSGVSGFTIGGSFSGPDPPSPDVPTGYHADHHRLPFSPGARAACRLSSARSPA